MELGMLRTIFALICLVVVGVSLSSREASAGFQLSPRDVLTGDNVMPITFWAHPYPYGYTGWRRCPRVRIETPYGWYWDRLCSNPAQPVLRRAY